MQTMLPVAPITGNYHSLGPTTLPCGAQNATKSIYATLHANGCAVILNNLYNPLCILHFIEYEA